MGDVANPEEGERQQGKEIDVLMAERNLRLIAIEFIDEIPYWELDLETRQALKAIHAGERLVKGDETETGLTLRYNTKTGQIGLPSEEFQLGEFSVIRTYLVNKGKQIEYDEEKHAWVTKVKGTNFIRLWIPGAMPMPHEYLAIMAGEEDQLSGEGRKILPERMLPNESLNSQGIFESWGKSQFVDDAHGDMVMLRTIQKFNQLHGPPS